MCIKIKNTYFNCALCFILALNSAVSRLCVAENSSGGSPTVSKIDFKYANISLHYYFVATEELGFF